jgi:hypothetical protein
MSLNPLIPLIFIVLLAVIYSGMIKDSANRLMVLLAILVAVLVFCFVILFKSSDATGRRMGLSQLWGSRPMEGYTGAPVDYVMGQTLVPGKADLAVGCDGYDYNQAGKAGSIIPKTGFYDGLVLDPKMKNKDYKLLARTNVAYHSPVGDAYALNPDPVESANFPPVDGQPGSPKQLAMFAYNNVSPYCCPSTYSSDRGCVCMTPQQYNYINSRGYQKSYNGNPDM